jgi:hypothetical protein
VSSPKYPSQADQRLDQAWQPLFALALVELLEGLLSDALSLRTLAPSNELAEIISLTLTAVLFFSSLLAWLFASSRTARALTMVFAGWVTAGLVYSIFALVLTMPARARSGEAFALLSDAVLVWIVNILIFAVWYWLVDSGGLAERQRLDYLPHDFVFPQQANSFPGWGGWRPGFFDYIFLAFNASTAFSPTDTLILSKRVKALTMLQAAISLIALATLAAFAVNLMAR